MDCLARCPVIALLAVAAQIESGVPLSVKVDPVGGEDGFVVRALRASVNRLDRRWF